MIGFGLWVQIENLLLNDALSGSRITGRHHRVSKEDCESCHEHDDHLGFYVGDAKHCTSKYLINISLGSSNAEAYFLAAPAGSEHR